ncbi:MAG: dienelactone hydrolase family protein [Gemmatimonadetes bacterium]|nr:dienelactone hydrolase family protein [Gemmatimonadota bacterium]
MTFPRTALFLAAVVASGSLSAQDRPTDDWLSRPVDDRTFRAYLEFFAYDPALPFATRVFESGEQEGLFEEHFSYQSTPGVTVTARLYRPRHESRGRPGGVIFLHGGGPQAKDAVISVQLSRLMARAAWSVLSIDLVHWGGRKTGLLETYSEPEKHERLYNQPAVYLDFVTQTAKDVSRGFDFLVHERGVDSTRIALVGFSRGAQLAMIVGGAERRVASVALLHGGHFDFYETGHRAAACPANYIGRISPRPVLMINGENDADYVPDTSVRPLQRLLKEPKRIRWTPGGHGFLSEEDRTALVDWLRTAVPQ